MRTVQVHDCDSIRCTENALRICNELNQYRRNNPTATFAKMAEVFNLSETNARRYYYGIHHKNNGFGYTQFRSGSAAII